MTYDELIINFLNIIFTFLLSKIDSKQKSILVNFHKNQRLRSYIYVWFSSQWEKGCFPQYWPYLYLLNYQFLWEFTRILFCSESILIIKNMKIYIISNNKVFLFLFKYKNRIKTIYIKNYYVLIPDLNSAQKTG